MFTCVPCSVAASKDVVTVTSGPPGLQFIKLMSLEISHRPLTSFRSPPPLGLSGTVTRAQPGPHGAMTHWVVSTVGFCIANMFVVARVSSTVRVYVPFSSGSAEAMPAGAMAKTAPAAAAGRPGQ